MIDFFADIRKQCDKGQKRPQTRQKQHEIKWMQNIIKIAIQKRQDSTSENGRINWDKTETV